MQEPVYKTDLWCARGHFNEDQADKYAQICEEVHPRHVLEIGFCTGRSAACVLYNAYHSLEQMISIDKNLDWKAPEGRRMAAILEDRFPAFQVIERNSHEVLTAAFFHRVFPHGIDLATVDGDHSYEGCMSDLMSIVPYLSGKAVMVVDDYRSGPPNGVCFQTVTRSVDDFLTKNHGVLYGESWSKAGKGFCIIRQRPSIVRYARPNYFY